MPRKAKIKMMKKETVLNMRVELKVDLTDAGGGAEAFLGTGAFSSFWKPAMVNWWRLEV